MHFAYKYSDDERDLGKLERIIRGDQIAEENNDAHGINPKDYQPGRCGVGPFHVDPRTERYEHIRDAEAVEGVLVDAWRSCEVQNIQHDPKIMHPNIQHDPEDSTIRGFQRSPIGHDHFSHHHGEGVAGLEDVVVHESPNAGHFFIFSKQKTIMFFSV